MESNIITSNKYCIKVSSMCMEVFLALERWYIRLSVSQSGTLPSASSKAYFLKPLSKLWIHNFGFNYRLVDKCNCRSRESVVTVVWIINWSTT